MINPWIFLVNGHLRLVIKSVNFQAAVIEYSVSMKDYDSGRLTHASLQWLLVLGLN